MHSAAAQGATRCLFCDIIARRAPAHILYEDDTTLAFLAKYPVTRGHLLVVPKRHGARLTDLPWEDQMALVRTLDTLCRRAERLSPDYNLSLNAGANAGQVVFHAHFHIIPRYGEADPWRSSARPTLAESDAKTLVSELSPVG
jgi:histidine triad (HIT) family protein